jgi:hypothetical protein
MFIAGLLHGTPLVAADPGGKAPILAVSTENVYSIFEERFRAESADGRALERAQEARRAGRGLKFDPLLEASGSRQFADYAPKNQVETRRYEVSQNTPWGLTLGGYYQQSQQKVEATEQTAASSSKDELTGVRVSQQLLKDGFYGGLVTDDLNDITYDIGIKEAALRKEEALYGVLAALLGYEEAATQLRLAQSSYDFAVKMHGIVKELVDDGFRAKADLLVAEAQELQSHEGLIDAKDQLEKTRDALKISLWIKDSGDALEVGATEFSQAQKERLDRVLATKVELLAVTLATLRTREADLSLKKARRDNLPTLAVEYNAEKARSEGASGDKPAHSIALQFSMPLGSTFGASSLSVARIDHSMTRARQSEEKLTAELDEKQLQKDIERYSNAVKVRTRLFELSERSLAIEQQKYADGKSAIMDLKKYQDDRDAAGAQLAAATKSLLLAKFSLAAKKGLLSRVFTND